MVIEKNVPFPPGWKTRKGFNRHGPNRSLVETMQPGDSILCTSANYEAVRKCGYRCGFKIATHRSDEGWRIWRVA